MSRQLCTPESPMPKNAKGYWAHRDVEEVGNQEDGYPSGDIQTYRCKSCGKMWKEELPQ